LAQALAFRPSASFCFDNQKKAIGASAPVYWGEMACCFQVQLEGCWQNFDKSHDSVLKRAFLSGLDAVPYKLGSQRYQVDFCKMTQTNLTSKKVRPIRPPLGWMATTPSEQCLRVTVPDGAPGTCIYVPDPRTGGFLAVDVPASARVGSSILAPLPQTPAVGIHLDSTAKKPFDSFKPSAPVDLLCTEEKGAALLQPAKAPAAKAKEKWSTGGKVAAGGAAALAVGGLAVAGVVLGEHIADHGWDAVAADVGDAMTDAGDAIVHAAEDVGDWIDTAAHDAGDFMMDLF